MRKDIAALRTDLKKEIETATTERQKLAVEQQQRGKALQDALDQLSRASRNPARIRRRSGEGAERRGRLARAAGGPAAPPGRAGKDHSRPAEVAGDREPGGRAAEEGTGAPYRSRCPLQPRPAAARSRAAGQGPRALPGLPRPFPEGRAGGQRAVLAGRDVLRGKEMERRHRRVPEGAQGPQGIPTRSPTLCSKSACRSRPKATARTRCSSSTRWGRRTKALQPRRRPTTAPRTAGARRSKSGETSRHSSVGRIPYCVPEFPVVATSAGDSRAAVRLPPSPSGRPGRRA